MDKSRNVVKDYMDTDYMHNLAPDGDGSSSSSSFLQRRTRATEVDVRPPAPIFFLFFKLGDNPLSDDVDVDSSYLSRNAEMWRNVAAVAQLSQPNPVPLLDKESLVKRFKGTVTSSNSCKGGIGGRCSQPYEAKISSTGPGR